MLCDECICVNDCKNKDIKINNIYGFVKLNNNFYKIIDLSNKFEPIICTNEWFNNNFIVLTNKDIF